MNDISKPIYLDVAPAHSPFPAYPSATSETFQNHIGDPEPVVEASSHAEADRGPSELCELW